MEDLIAYLKEEIATAPGECFVISKKQARKILEKIDYKKSTVEWDICYSAADICNILEELEDRFISMISEHDGRYIIFYKIYE